MNVHTEVCQGRKGEYGINLISFCIGYGNLLAAELKHWMKLLYFVTPNQQFSFTELDCK